MYNGSGDKRPKLQISFSNLEKTIRFIAAIGVGLNVALTVIYWTKLPDRFATHFDLSGKANGWGGKGVLIFLPIITLILYFAMTALEKYPEIYNYIGEINEENAERQYRNSREMIIFIKTELVCMFGYMQWVIIQGALNNSLSLSPWYTAIVLVVIFATVGYFTYKAAKLK